MLSKKHQHAVHKFGGSSLINADSFRTVIKRLTGDEVIVVSAVQGTTSKLQALLDHAKNNQPISPALDKIKTKHIDIINALFEGPAAASLIADLEEQIIELRELLKTTQVVKDYSRDIQSIVIGYGEVWAAKILATLLGEHALYLNAADVVFTFEKRGILDIDWERSKAALDAFLKDKKFNQLVVTGFLARDSKGKRVTLGRNGSDFSAAIFSKLMLAKELVIWKDVDGVFSADPSRVRQAFAIPYLSYESALELAYFGAKVIHPKTIAPAMELNIPIRIKNTLKPELPGTLISSDAPDSELAVQGLTSIDQVGLINIEGTGLVGVSGTSARVFTVLSKNHISVILISQASSEHSICFAVQLDEVDKALEVLVHAFEFEIKQHLVSRIFADKDCAILAAVGDGMVGSVGILSRFTGTLAKANVNVRAIAQGSSERNISIVVKSDDIDKALKAVHAGFYLSTKTLSIGIIGPGVVGATLIEQISDQLERLRSQHQVNLRVRGICNSKKMLFADEQIDLKNWAEDLEQSDQPTDLDAFAKHIVSDDMPHALIIDCSANQQVVDHYVGFIERGAHIITPNKRMNSGDYTKYKELKALANKKGRHYLYETTVCAGLPVITSLHDIIQTGDEVIQVEGVVSGTLSYIFNQLALGKPFSEIIFEAKNGGYTEPDPRDDLAGTDVARKVVILARELGFQTKLEDVGVTNLVPKKLRSCDLDKFMRELPSYDAEIKAQIDAATIDDEQPVYLGLIQQDGSITVGIKSFAKAHPFSRLSGTDNMLIFKTERYNQQPLVIQGPGAGAEVTAAGVFADLLRLVSFIG